jgi:hypothetical protein
MGFGMVTSDAGAFQILPEDKMKKIALAAALLAVSTVAAFAQAGTVDAYTPAQLAKAKAAVQAAGYTPGTLGASQAGNFFINAKKGGDSYMVTVTPDDQVFAGPPLGAVPTVPKPPMVAAPGTVPKPSGSVSGGD